MNPASEVMAWTFVLIPGAGIDPGVWRWTIEELEARGHRGVAPRLPLDDPEKAIERARAFADAGVTALVHGARYADTAAFSRKSVTLAPGESVRVDVTVTIPANPCARGVLADFLWWSLADPRRSLFREIWGLWRPNVLRVGLTGGPGSYRNPRGTHWMGSSYTSNHRLPC